MKRIHDLAGVTAGIGLSAAFVGLFDRLTSRADIGVSLLVGGICLLVLSIAVLAITSRSHSLKSPLILAGGIVPFAAFGLFLVWRIGLSGDQASACDEGDAVACRTLGERRFKRQKMDDARALLNSGCELGDAESCVISASIERLVHGDHTDHYRERLSDGCEMGSGLSCYRLYLLSEENLDRPSIPSLSAEEEARLLSRACELGYRPACVDFERSQNDR